MTESKEKIQKILAKADQFKEDTELGLAKNFIEIGEKVDDLESSVIKIAEKIGAKGYALVELSDDAIEEMKSNIGEMKEVLSMKLDRDELKGDPGNDGKDADEDLIIEKVSTKLAKSIPKKEDIKKAVLAEIVIPTPENGEPGKDGNDADEEAIIKKIESDLPKLGLGIRDALENLPNGTDNEEDERLDVKAIKGLKEWFDSIKIKSNELVVGGIRYLSELADVRITNIQNNDVLKWDSATREWKNGVGGGGAATWGSITGTLSSQTDLQTALDAKQPLDADLTTIAGLTATTDNFIQSKAGAWASRTIAQVMADLGLAGTNLGDQTSIVGITGNTAQFNAALSDGDFATLAGTEVLSNKTLTAPVINGVPSGTGVATAPTVSTLALRDANGNLSSNSFIKGGTTTATAAGTTTLTVASTQIQVFTGATTQTLVLPVTSTLALFQQYFIRNNSTGIVTVQSSGANTIQAMAAGSHMWVTVVLTSGTTAASWSNSYVPDLTAVKTETNTTLTKPVIDGTPTATGQLGYDTTLKMHTGWSELGGVAGKITKTLSFQQSDSDNLSAPTITTVETAWATNWTIPANFLVTNKAIRVTASFQWIATAVVPTSIIRIRAGGVGGTLLQQGQTTAFPAGSGYNQSIQFIMNGTAAATGSSPVETHLIAGHAGNTFFGREARTSQPVNFATNASQVLCFTMQYSAGTASNSCKLKQLLIEEIN